MSDGTNENNSNVFVCFGFFFLAFCLCMSLKLCLTECFFIFCRYQRKAQIEQDICRPASCHGVSSIVTGVNEVSHLVFCSWSVQSSRTNDDHFLCVWPCPEWIVHLYTAHRTCPSWGSTHCSSFYSDWLKQNPDQNHSKYDAEPMISWQHMNILINIQY